MKTEYKLPKNLDWVLIPAENEHLKFDCPKCFHKTSIGLSTFNSENYQEREDFKLTDQKFAYTDKGLVVLANIIAFGITLAILFGLLGDLMDSEEYGKLTYLLGIPIMLVLGRILIPIFRKTLPIWLLKCANCNEWIIVASNGKELHLARETKQEKTTDHQENTSDKKTSTLKNDEVKEKDSSANSGNATLWDLKNGNKNAKADAALDLIFSKHPNAVELILKQALEENYEPEKDTIFTSSTKNELLNLLLLNSKKIRTPQSVDAYINVLSSNDEPVINHAIIMLEKLGSAKAIEPLEKLINDGYKGLKPGGIEKSILKIKKKKGLT